MAIADPLHQDEPVVEEPIWVFTREWYSWLGGLVEGIRADHEDIRVQLDAIRARLDALENP